MKTAEAVSPKHPDKLCDQISDAILDACLEQDPMSRVAIETMGGHGIITITGELTTKAYINAREIAQRIAGSQYGVQTNIVSQSPEIAQGVDTGGAGDQGIMVGYACNDNEDMIPQELYLARSLFQYICNWYEYLFENVYQGELFCNPAGDWSQGEFDADTGLTGRKLMVDNYGPQIPIGGGCFSGKDATKVDRSAAYMARKIAVGLLKKYNAREVIVKIAYAIGIAEPVMVTAEVDGKQEIMKSEELQFLTPQVIIKSLDLRRPQYEKLAMWGHFGVNAQWDK